MKKFRIAVLLLGILFFVPASGFALVDAGIYGGYSFAGKIDTGASKNPNTSGWEYGAIVHYNFGLAAILNIGIGGFVQQTPLKYSVTSIDFKVTKTDYALDAFVMLDLPVFPIHPFIRGGVGVYETLKLDDGSSVHKSFNSYHFGLGVAWSLIPYLQIYGEYLYNSSKQEDDIKLTGNSVHVGVRLFI